MPRRLLSITLAALAAWTAPAWCAEPLAYEPVALGWSADEVERASADSMRDLTQRAQQARQFGCEQHCARLDRIFSRLLAQARAQSPSARDRPWSLTVVRLPGVEAMALPGGQLIVSEFFIDERGLSDAALAFVLAHEMAHSILEHERQALTFARMLLPRHVHRSVRDMYTEMDFNLRLLKAMEPVMQQGELEADELGLLLAAQAGYAPEQQLAFIESEAALETGGGKPVVATHPPALLRLEKLRERLPLARRLVPLAAEPAAI
jgi:predicted Zn-dependent protease